MSDALFTPPTEALTEQQPLVGGHFTDLPINADVLEALQMMGYTAPTDVQVAVIAPGVSGRDMQVQSKTGSGKTISFAIPMLERLAAQTAQPGCPLGLVLLPTRELAQQVATEMGRLAAKQQTKIFAIYGGVPIGRQITALRSGVDIVVGTPGRLLDHIRRKILSLEAVRVAVLDEADEMLSMGFWDEVTELLQMTPTTRQTMLFSATLPYEVAKSAAHFLREPVRIDLSGDSLTVAGIENCIVHVAPDVPKPRQLMYLLETLQSGSAIIFCNTRNETEMIAKYLTQSGLVAAALSGSLKQKDREWVMHAIKNGDLRYMVATDIAARGIDIHDLTHVINYSLPEFSDVYLHRVGRTGRIGKIGTAISLVDGKGLGTLSQLENVIGIQFKTLLLPPEEEAMHARSQRMMKELAEKAAVAEIGQQLPVAQDILTAGEGAQIVAFLLKNYFNQQADLLRRPHEAVAKQPTSHTTAHDQQTDTSATGKRRRKGRGSQRNPVSNNRSGGRNHNQEAQRRPQEGRFEIVDAVDMLADDYKERIAAKHSSQHSKDDVAHIAAAQLPPDTNDVPDNLTRIRVNIGFDDGFKGRGAVAKKISALAGLNEGIVQEVEARRDYAVLKASPEIIEMVMERVDGAPLGKKVIAVTVVVP